MILIPAEAALPDFIKLSKDLYRNGFDEERYVDNGRGVFV